MYREENVPVFPLADSLTHFMTSEKTPSDDKDSDLLLKVLEKASEWTSS